MAIKKVKPTSPGRRFQTYDSFEEITRTTPERRLLKTIRKSGGRNSNGRITIRHRGGGHKRNYRIIDFKRDKTGIPAKVAAIEYDPSRSARIALLHYRDGEKRYILLNFMQPCMPAFHPKERNLIRGSSWAITIWNFQKRHF